MSVLVAGTLFVASPKALAQMQMPLASTSSGFNVSLAKFFGANKAFSAQTQAVIGAKATREISTIPMGFALLDGKIRMELDLTQIKSKQMTPEAVSMVKQMGMNRMTTIISPEEKLMRVVYPSLQAYVELPLSDDQGGELKIETSEVGKETVESHPCAKRKVVVTDQKGRKQEGFTWNATDLKDFPVKMEFADTDATITMVFRDIKLSPPDPKTFEAPAGFTKQPDMQTLMMSVAQKSTGVPASK